MADSVAQQLADQVHELLDEAAELDAEAYALRKDAGRLLVRLQAETPTGQPWLPAGIDERTARRLIQLAAGAIVRGDPDA